MGMPRGNERKGLEIMKRSEINAIIKDFESKLNEFKFALPPFLS